MHEDRGILRLLGIEQTFYLDHTAIGEGVEMSGELGAESGERIARFQQCHYLARRQHPIVDANLSGQPAKFAQAFTEKLMMYAVNRELEYFDMPQVRAVVRGAAKDQYTLSSIVQGIVRSDAFLKQGPAGSRQAAGTKVAAN